jgi:hypothetical protein
LGINLDNAIELYGVPKDLLIYTDWCNPSPIFSLGDVSCKTIHVFNPDSGVWFGYQTLYSENIEIKPNTRVTHIGFYNPVAYNDLVKGQAFYGFTSEEFLKYTRPWVGYGKLTDQ